MKRAKDWEEELSSLLQNYKYQPNLTLRLDSLTSDPFDQSLVNEIVLWKVNRYAPLEREALAALNHLASVQPGDHRKADAGLRLLLRQPGVDLPMASTLLRFRNPGAFQIIDRHAYRAVTGDDYPLHSTSGDERKVYLYFSYLDELITLANLKNVPFKDLDRVLYVFDKQENGTL